MTWGKSETFLNQTVTNQPFFPDIKLGDLQRDYRIAAEHEAETVVHHLSLAMLEVNELLAGKKTEWEAEGHSDLASVPADTMGASGQEQSLLVINYYRAVCSKVKALLMQQYASMYQVNIDDDEELNAAHWIGEANAAIRFFTDQRSRIACEVI